MQTLTDIIILPQFIYIDLYANRLVELMPKIGTFQSNGDMCNLWFCKNGRYIPGYCSDGGGRECGEILVSTGLRLFYEKASILIEVDSASSKSKLVSFDIQAKLINTS